MRRALALILLVLHQLIRIEVRAISVGIVHNVSLTILDANATLINGTCEECVCSLLANPAFFSLNCRPDILTCELHSTQDQNRPFNLLTGTSTAFYFRSLPTFVETTTAMDDTCVHEVTSTSTSKPDELCPLIRDDRICSVYLDVAMTGSSLAPGEYLWSFDSNFQDSKGTYNGTPINNPTFSPSTITGYGSSLSLNSSASQFLSINQPFISLFGVSWTFEAWIYIPELENANDYPVGGQCESRSFVKCLHLVVRAAKLWFGFYGDDLFGVTNLTASRWYHVAFVFETDQSKSVTLSRWRSRFQKSSKWILSRYEWIFNHRRSLCLGPHHISQWTDRPILVH